MKTAPCPSLNCCARLRQGPRGLAQFVPPSQIVAVEVHHGTERFGYGARVSPETWSAVHLGGAPLCAITEADFERLRLELADG